jgi:tetratricopeptide (TPR) repeat protein
VRFAISQAIDDGDIARAEILNAELRDAAEQAEDEELLLSVTFHEAVLAMKKGDLDGARAHFVRIKASAAERGDRKREASAILNLGWLATASGNFRAGLEYSTQAAELWAGLDREVAMAAALVNCGWNALGLGDPGLASESFRRALLVAGPFAALPVIAEGVAGLAATLVMSGEEPRGAQLLGAGEALRDELQPGFNDELQEEIQRRAVADAKAALGEEAFAAAWALGRTMTHEEILALCHEQ